MPGKVHFARHTSGSPERRSNLVVQWTRSGDYPFRHVGDGNEREPRLDSRGPPHWSIRRLDSVSSSS